MIRNYRKHSADHCECGYILVKFCLNYTPQVGLEGSLEGVGLWFQWTQTENQLVTKASTHACWEGSTEEPKRLRSL